jgi:hypothetical protein
MSREHSTRVQSARHKAQGIRQGKWGVGHGANEAWEKWGMRHTHIRIYAWGNSLILYAVTSVEAMTVSGYRMSSASEPIAT